MPGSTGSWPRARALAVLLLELAAGAASTLALAVLALNLLRGILGPGVRLVDRQVAEAVYRWRSPGLTAAMRLLTHLGAAYPMAAAIAVAVPLAWKEHKKRLVTLVIVLVMGVVINLLLKGIFQRARPAMAPLVGAAGYSFPSGHSMNAMVFYSAVAFLAYRYADRRLVSLLVVALSSAIVLAVGFSRVYLGVHYPADVLAGYAVGAWWLAAALLVSRSRALAVLLESRDTGAPR
ncbi:MAG: phosphatase PAP2 family protein [bacterium]